MSDILQENSIQEANQIKILEETNNDNITININDNAKKGLINNESVISDVIKQTENEINVTGPVASNNSIILNN